MLKIIYNCRIEYLIIIILIIAYFLPWISWNMLSISGFDLPFMYKKMTNISNKIHFYSKKEFLYTAFYLYSVPILAISSGLSLFMNKTVLSKILLFIGVVNGVIVSLYMCFYLTTSSVLKMRNGGLGLCLLFICSSCGIYYLIFSYRKNRIANRPFLNKSTDI